MTENVKRLSSRAALVAGLLLVVAGTAGCGGDTPPAPETTVSTDPSVSASPGVTTEAAPPPPPMTNYQYAQSEGPDLCEFLVDYPQLLAIHDRVERIDVPANPLECALDLRIGEVAHLLDIKIQLNQSDAAVYVWRNVDGAMGALTPVDGLGQGTYFFDTDLGRTLVVRDANLLARVQLVPNVNSGGAPVSADQHLMLLFVAQHLMEELRVPA